MSLPRSVDDVRHEHVSLEVEGLDRGDYGARHLGEGCTLAAEQLCVLPHSPARQKRRGGMPSCGRRRAETEVLCRQYRESVLGGSCPRGESPYGRLRCKRGPKGA